MVSLLALLTRLVVVSRRSIAAIVAYAAMLGVLYADPGPLADAYVPTSAALVVITAWLVVAGVSGVTADRSTAHLLAAAAHGPRRLHLLLTASGVLSAAPLVVLSLLGGLLRVGVSSWAVVVAGLAAHVVAALVGAGLGSVGARSVVGEPALAPALVIGGFILVMVINQSSPIGPVLHLLRTTGSDAGLGLPAAAFQGAGWCALAVGWAVVLTVIGSFVADRRRTYGTNAAA